MIHAAKSPNGTNGNNASSIVVNNTNHNNNNKNNHRVKFIDLREKDLTSDYEPSSSYTPSPEENSYNSNSMNQSSFASSQPIVNGHLVTNAAADLAESQKLANSHPHVTISSHHDHPRNEDRNFGTKIDK